MGNTLYVRKTVHEQTIHHDRLRFSAKEGAIVDYLNMTSKANDLPTNLTLETKDDTNRKYHDRKSDRHAPLSNGDGWARNATHVVTMSKQAACYGKFETHDLSFPYVRDKLPMLSEGRTRHE